MPPVPYVLTYPSTRTLGFRPCLGLSTVTWISRKMEKPSRAGRIQNCIALFCKRLLSMLDAHFWWIFVDDTATQTGLRPGLRHRAIRVIFGCHVMLKVFCPGSHTTLSPSRGNSSPSLAAKQLLVPYQMYSLQLLLL